MLVFIYFITIGLIYLYHVVLILIFKAVQVKLEFGHKARMPSNKAMPDGYTHEWTVFVRGPDGCDIQHFVEKVVFQLHESFNKPKRGLFMCASSLLTALIF